MEIVYERVGGLDVHKKSVTVTARVPDPRKGRVGRTRTFKTYTRDLLAMARWMVDELGVTHAAMESTGVYWVPVFEALREVGGDRLRIEVVNAAHFKAVPGRKTDVKDSEWLAQLLEAGLLKGSFVPPDEVRRLRDMTRYQTKLTEERSREKQRLLKILELGGIKLDSVASDTFGVSGRLMLQALVDGERDPAVLAELARGRLRAKIDDLRLAMSGRFTDHHAGMVRLHLERIEHLDRMLDQVTARIGAFYTDDNDEIVQPARACGLIAAFAPHIALLTSIPGIGFRTACVIVSEIGVDMGQFPSANHLAAWAGLAPGNNESAGKRRRTRRRKGNRYLVTIMVEAASGAARTDTRVGARFRRLHRRFGGQPRRRRGNNVDPGWKRAAFATAHTLIKIVYHVLLTGQPYHDLGSDFYDRTINTEARARSLLDQLERLTGKKITITEEPASTPAA